MALTPERERDLREQARQSPHGHTAMLLELIDQLRVDRDAAERALAKVREQLDHIIAHSEMTLFTCRELQIVLAQLPPAKRVRVLSGGMRGGKKGVMTPPRLTPTDEAKIRELLRQPHGKTDTFGRMAPVIAEIDALRETVRTLEGELQKERDIYTLMSADLAALRQEKAQAEQERDRWKEEFDIQTGVLRHTRIMQGDGE